MKARIFLAATTVLLATSSTFLAASVTTVPLPIDSDAGLVPPKCDLASTRALLAADSGEVSKATTIVITEEQSVRTRDGKAVNFCRVLGYVTTNNPGPNQVNFGLELPVDWNGRFLFGGQGGAGGSLNRPDAEKLVKGFATASTDTGHQGAGLDWRPINTPAKKLDFYGNRGVHVSAIATQTITKAYYGAPEKMFAYFQGCSGGGREALGSIRDHPADFDGVVAGAPGSGPPNGALLQLHLVKIAKELASGPDRFIPADKLSLLNTAFTAACDGDDGAVDGIITDPRQCKFDVRKLQCAPGQDGPSCLSAGQIRMFDAIITPTYIPGTKTMVYPGFSLTNFDWGYLLGRTPPKIGQNPPWKVDDPKDNFNLPASYNVPNNFFQNIWEGYGTNYDFMTSFDVNSRSDFEGVLKTNRAARNELAEGFDLNALEKAGKKVIIWHGWGDGIVAPMASVGYYDYMEKRFGGNRDRLQKFERLILTPGTHHCAGGTGASDVSDRMLDAVIAWAEEGRAPDAVIGTRAATATLPRKTFRFCTYPKSAVYKGSGDVHDANNYTCQIPGARRG